MLFVSIHLEAEIVGVKCLSARVIRTLNYQFLINYSRRDHRACWTYSHLFSHSGRILRVLRMDLALFVVVVRLLLLLLVYHYNKLCQYDHRIQIVHHLLQNAILPVDLNEINRLKLPRSNFYLRVCSWINCRYLEFLMWTFFLFLLSLRDMPFMLK